MRRILVEDHADHRGESLAMNAKIERWYLCSLLMKVITIGTKLIELSRYMTFQMAEVSVSREIFAEILSRIKRL